MLARIGRASVATVQAPTDRDDPGSDQADAARPHRLGGRARVHSLPLPEGRQDRDRPPPGDDHAGEQREAGSDADEIADADEGQGKAGPEPEHGPTGLQGGVEALAEDAQAARRDCDQSRRPSGAEQIAQTVPAAVSVLGSGTGLQHFGGSHAFGKRQPGLGHERPPQRDRKGDAEQAADEADPSGLPERKSLPMADQHEAGQDQDDVAERAGSRGLRLHDVVLENRGLAEQPQQAHRQHRGGNR